MDIVVVSTPNCDLALQMSGEESLPTAPFCLGTALTTSSLLSSVKKDDDEAGATSSGSSSSGSSVTAIATTNVQQSSTCSVDGIKFSDASVLETHTRSAHCAETVQF